MTPSIEAPPEVDEKDIIHAIRGNPVKFMSAFWGMSRRPDRYQIGFHHTDLEWIALVWDAAYKASVSDLRQSRLRQAFEHERDRYRKLAIDLKNGEHERQDSGTVFLNERSDWPRDEVLREAVKILARYAPERIIH